MAEQVRDGYGVDSRLERFRRVSFAERPRWYFLPIFFSNRQKAQLIASFVHGLPSELSSSGPVGCGFS